MSSNFKAFSVQRISSASVSASGVCVMCLSLEVLCLECEDYIMKLFETTVCRSLMFAVKEVACFIGN